MFTILAKDPCSRARAGVLTTPHGIIETPAYAIVGSRAAVKCLRAEDLNATDTQLVMANAYHLWRSLGTKGLRTYQGLHSAMGWRRPIMTDSGGFQVFSLGFAREHGTGKLARSPSRRQQENLTRITDDGVWFAIDGEEQYLDAELSMEIQRQLGADLIIAFDECTSPIAGYEYTKEALERTHQWAGRSLKAKTTHQFLYGVVQGGPYRDLREESARTIGTMEFDGIAIGGAFGSSFGDSRESTFKELEWVAPFLPEGKPRHLLGIGGLGDLVRAVSNGMDTFDCVAPTREARHGWLWTDEGKLDCTKGVYRDDLRSIVAGCECPACGQHRITRRQLWEAFHTKDANAGIWATMHNVYFIAHFMSTMRQAILDGRFQQFYDRYSS